MQRLGSGVVAMLCLPLSLPERSSACCLAVRVLLNSASLQPARLLTTLHIGL